MWKLKLASKVVGNPLSGSSSPKRKIAKYARWVGLGTALALLLLGIIGCIVKPIWTGIFSIIVSFPIFIIEFALAPFALMAKLLNFFRDYRFKIPVFLVITVPLFFNFATIFAGIACVACAILYAVCWFNGETGPEVKVGWKPVPDAENKNPGEETKEGSNNKKKFSLSSLGI